MSFTKNISHTFGSRIVQLAISIGTSAMVARWLGPELNGKAILLLTAPTFLFMLGNLGFGSALSFYAANNKYDRPDIVNVAILSSGAFSGVCIALFLATYELHSAIWQNIDMMHILLAVSITPLVFLNNFFTRICIGCNNIISSNNVNIISSLIQFGLIAFFFFLFPPDAAKIVIVNLVLLVCNVAGCCWILRPYLKFKKINRNLVRSSFSYGMSIYAALLISYLNLRMDMYLVKYLTQNDVSVGYYSIAVGIAEMAWMLPESVASVLFPVVAASKKKEDGITKTVLSVKYTLLFMLIAIFGVIAFAKPAITLVYGKQYLPAYMSIVFLAPGIVFYPVMKILGVDIAARGRPGFVTATTLLGFIVNTLANLFLIPKYGIAGAAMASTFSYTSMSLMVMFFFKKLTGIPLHKLILLERNEVAKLYSSVKSFSFFHKR
jgi:O-antigen/teichoic acid export membrane protein